MSNNGKMIIIDEAIIDKYDSEAGKFFLLKESEAITLVSLCQFIGWRTRWANLTKTQQQLNELEAQITDALLTPIESLIMDCNDVENCLPTAPTIVSMETDITTNTTIINGNTDAIMELNESPPDSNIYPEPPTIETAPDKLCGASYRLTNKLIEIIGDTITDAQTITREEFLESFFTLGGWQGELLNQFWDYIASNYLIYPNLLTECQDEADTIAEFFYCNALDKTAVLSAIDTDTNMLPQVIASFYKALDSMTEQQMKQQIFIGTNDLTQDCTAFCPTEILAVFDFAGDYTPVGSETVYTDTINWTIQDGALIDGHITDDYSKFTISRSFAMNVTHWSVTGRKNSNQDKITVNPYFDGVYAPVPIEIIHTSDTDYAKTAINLDESPLAVLNTIAFQGLRSVGSMNNVGGIKYLKLWGLS